MSDAYKELDAAILNAIERGVSPIYAHESNKIADELAVVSKRESFRIIDGRLQALKKAKVIEFVRGKKPHWVLRAAKP